MPQKPRDEKIAANHFEKIRSYLAKMGVSQARIGEVIGAGTARRTRAEIAKILREWVRTLPESR